MTVANTLAYWDYRIACDLKSTVVTTLSITMLCHFAESHYTESRVLFFIVLIVIMLNVIMLIVIMLSVIMPSVIMMSVIMMNVIILSVMVLFDYNVLTAPWSYSWYLFITFALNFWLTNIAASLGHPDGTFCCRNSINVTKRSNTPGPNVIKLFTPAVNIDMF